MFLTPFTWNLANQTEFSITFSGLLALSGDGPSAFCGTSLPFYVMQTPSCPLRLSPTLIYICILVVLPFCLPEAFLVFLCAVPSTQNTFPGSCSLSLYLADTYSSFKTHLGYLLQQEALSDLQSGSEASFGTPTVSGLCP